MKKYSIPLFIAGIILPCSMLLPIYFFIDYAVTSIMLLQVIFVIFNCLAVKKLIPYIILSANLFVCSLAAYQVLFMLDTSYVYCDPNSTQYIIILVIACCINCVLLPLTGWLMFLLKKAFDYDNKLNSEVTASLNKNSRIGFAITSLALILVTVLSIIYFAWLLNYSSVRGFVLWGSSVYLTNEEERVQNLLIVSFIVSFCAMSAGITMSFFERRMGRNALIVAINARVISFAFIALLYTSRVIYHLTAGLYFDEI